METLEFVLVAQGRMGKCLLSKSDLNCQYLGELLKLLDLFSLSTHTLFSMNLISIPVGLFI